MSQVLDGSDLKLPVYPQIQKFQSQGTQAPKHLLSPNPSTPIHHPDKQKEKIILSGIERLLNRKVEFVGAKTIKQIQCKSETVNMLNRIGLPLAKKIKKEKSIKLRRELKLSIERETQQLLECSHPEKASILLQTFYEQEQREVEIQKQMLKKRLETSVNVMDFHSKRRETKANIPDVKDYQDIVLEDIKINKKPLNDSHNFKSIQIDTLNHNDSGMFKRQAMTAQNSARDRPDLTSQMKRSIFQATQSVESSKSKFYDQKQEQINDFIDSNIASPKNQAHRIKTSVYTNIIRNMASSSQSTATASINKGPIQLNKIQEERSPSQLQKSPSSIQQQEKPKSLQLHPIPIRNASKASVRGSNRNNSKDDKISQNLNHSQSKNITDSQTIQSEEKISDFNSQSPKKGVRFYENSFSNRRNSKNFSGVSNTSAHLMHSNTKGEFQFRDITVLLKKNLAPKTPGIHKEGTALEIKLSRFQTPKKNYVISNLSTFENKTYDEIFLVVDQYQRILDQINNIKMQLAKRPHGNSQAQMDFKKQQLYQSWLSAIDVCQENGDFTLIFSAYKFAGEIYLEFKDFQGAIKQFRQLKNLCDEKHKYHEKIYAFEQIGICYRLIEDYNQAIKFFRKQLELSWEQNDERSEISACDQLALTYFYLGDMEKAQHFNDRMMRGKLENDISVIKRVSKNLIISKRKRPKYEFYLNPDQLNDYLNRKQEQLSGKNQVTVDFGLSKAYKLLPHFTTKEEEDMLSNDDDYVEYGEDGQIINKKKEKIEVQSETFIIGGPKFITEDLVYLNNPPPYPYLPVTDPLLKKQKIYKRPTTQSKKQNSKNFSIRDYIGAEMFKYDLAPRNSHSAAQRPKLDGHQIFHNIIERVKQTDGGNNNLNMNQRGQSTVNHLSLLRTMAKNQILYTITVEALEKSLDYLKQGILKKQMLQFLRKWKLGLEYEEICYNI